jgi:hypothetical protein
MRLRRAAADLLPSRMVNPRLILSFQRTRAIIHSSPFDACGSFTLLTGVTSGMLFGLMGRLPKRDKVQRGTKFSQQGEILFGNLRKMVACNPLFSLPNHPCLGMNRVSPPLNSQGAGFTGVGRIVSFRAATFHTDIADGHFLLRPFCRPQKK